MGQKAMEGKSYPVAGFAGQGVHGKQTLGFSLGEESAQRKQALAAGLGGESGQGM